MIDDSIFDINPHYELSIEFIGKLKSKIVRVDNFLANPERLLDLLESIPLQDTIKEGVHPRGFYPGYQVYMTYDFGHLQRCANYLINQHYGYTAPYFNISYQCVDGNKKVYGQSSHPHCDDRTMAGNIFLNTDKELSENGNTGTTFYRLKDGGEESPFPNSCAYRKERYAFTTPDLSLKEFTPIWEEDDQYEKYHFTEAKFNTLYLYEGMLFHSVYMDKGSYRNYMRKTLSFIG
tara:strand:+ start:184 stop:885 length:702 start_codon:yes stop_codon:yes gene_type:complete